MKEQHADDNTVGALENQTNVVIDNDTNTIDQTVDNDEINNTEGTKELTLSEHRKEFIFDQLGERRPPPAEPKTMRTKVVQLGSLMRKTKQ